ncbi:MAG TPA: sn-glycerol-3-phosphate ABC transporter ATP-binding protein UgpC [Arenibaculum sp.]|nr:sn-glycerol-3-phosphate ABC transporter ATP-binding protein UgpC [Arenibaculum sp.]
MAFLEIDGIVKKYGTVSVLKGIDLSIEEGGFLVLVGPSGCGKSTLLNSIAGLESVTEGEIRIRGRRVNELRPSERDIAMVFQSYALYPNMTVADNIAFGLEMRGVPKPERQRAVNEAAEILKIVPLLDRKPSQLSGGQRQRVAMGRALVRNPQVFLFDEPLSNLDAKLRVDMRTEIKRLHQNLRTTTVYVTHDQVEAMTLATRIAVLKDGELQQTGTPPEIYHHPANIFVAEFMGSPSMNLMPVEVRASGGDVAVALGHGTAEPIVIPVAQANPGLRDRAGRTVLLGIRPESVTDVDGADRTARQIVHIPGRTDLVEPAGSDTFVVATVGDRQIVARMRSEAVVASDSDVELAMNMDRAVFFDPETERRIT